MEDGSRSNKDLSPDRLRPILAWEKDEEIGDIHFNSSNFTGALDYYARARKSAAEHSRSVKAAYLDLKLASCHKEKGEYSRAIESARSAKDIFHTAREPVGLGKACCFEGILHAEAGDYRKGRRLCEVGHRLLKGTGEFLELGKVQNWLGVIHMRLGNLAKAKESFEDALFAFRSIQNEEKISQVLNNLGLVHKNRSEWREAAGFFEKALGISERLGHLDRAATFSLNLGIVHFRLGEWDLAERHLTRALQIRTQTGNKAGAVRDKLALANISLRRREWTKAESAYRDVLLASRSLGYRREEALALEFMGELQSTRGDADAALKLLNEAAALAAELAPAGDVAMEIERRKGEVWLALGRLEEAEAAAAKAVEIARLLGDRCEEALAQRTLGLVQLNRDEWEKGWQTIESVLSTLTSIGERFEIARTQLLAGRTIASGMQSGRGSSEFAEKAVSVLRQSMGIFLSFEVKGWAALATAELARLYLTRGVPDESLGYIDEAERLLKDVDEPEISAALARVRRTLEEAFVSSTLSSSGEFKILEELGKLLGGSEDPEKTLDELMQLILARSDADRGLIAFVAPGMRPRIWAEQKFSAREALEVVAALTEAFRVDGLTSPLVVTSVHSDSVLSRLPILGRVQSFVLVPLSLPSGLKGVVYADRLDGNKLGAFKQRELNLLAVMSGIATLAAVEAERAVQRREKAASRKKAELACSFEGLVTENKDMLEILSLVQKVGASSATILIQGETGTGKTLVAEGIHNCSLRSQKPFVPISCSSIPESLLESELFGHVQGAFTGAIRDKRGLFEEAEGGTVFLDEVAKTTKSVQAKLLHFLDKKEIRAVGSTKWKKVDARIICATNVDLKSLMKREGFLEDLYYRLSDITITVPPLRQRRDDIPLLVEHFVRDLDGDNGIPARVVSKSAMQLLMDYDWPGNVRELEKTVKRMIVLAGQSRELTADLLPPELREHGPAMSEGTSLKSEVERTERRVISEALDKLSWNKARAAKLLGISYPTLLKKVTELRLDRRLH
ncbi:MAG: sigma 54-interacting transcriptional regulator [Candidatus Eisenbacteria bacterium]|nr:sigma 54-interacting transcriptional regulator [Candidatus Eisenbacteria bacterium]